MKCNFLFVIPKFGGFWPTGIAIVSSYLKKHGFNVFFLNTVVSPDTVYNQLCSAIKNNNITHVCTGGMSVYASEIQDVLSATKQIDSQITTIVGGPIITSTPELSFELINFDIGIVGEGEQSMVDLANALEKNDDISRVNGLIYKYNGQIIITPPRSAFEDLDLLPIPDYESLDFIKWSKSVIPDPFVPPFTLIDDLRIGEIITSRSCPFSCTFCYHPLGKKYRTRSLDLVFEEIDLLINKYGVNFINIQDELFSVNQERMLDFASRIKLYDVTWTAQFRVPNASEDILKILKTSGMRAVGLGVESASDSVLRSMRKQITQEQINAAYAAATNANIAPMGNLIFGDSEETDSTVDESINWWLEHYETPLQLGMILAIPDAPLYRKAVERGLINDEVEFIKAGFPLINMSKISEQKFEWLKRFVGSSYFKKIPSRSFGFVDKSEYCNNSDKFSLTVTCPRCKRQSVYNNFPFLGYGHLRIICRHIDCNRLMLIESKQAYRPILSIKYLGIIKYIKMQMMFVKNAHLVEIGVLKRYFPLVVGLIKKLFVKSQLKIKQ